MNCPPFWTNEPEALGGGFCRVVITCGLPAKMSASQKIVVPEGAGLKKPGIELKSGIATVVAPLWKFAVAVTVIWSLVDPTNHSINTESSICACPLNPE